MSSPRRNIQVVGQAFQQVTRFAVVLVFEEVAIRQHCLWRVVDVHTCARRPRGQRVHLLRHVGKRDRQADVVFRAGDAVEEPDGVTPHIRAFLRCAYRRQHVWDRLAFGVCPHLPGEVQGKKNSCGNLLLEDFSRHLHCYVGVKPQDA